MYKVDLHNEIKYKYFKTQEFNLFTSVLVLYTECALKNISILRIFCNCTKLLKDVLFDRLVSAVVDTTTVVARSVQIDASGYPFHLSAALLTLDGAVLPSVPP